MCLEQSRVKVGRHNAPPRRPPTRLYALPLTRRGALAEASEQDIAAALSSLGLEWRAQKVTHFARAAWSRFGRGLSAEPDSLRQMPGMGQYVPEATAIIVQGRGALPVDTGIARFLNRFYGLSATGELRRKKEILSAARNLGSCSRQLFFTLVDFCVAVCVANNPRCDICPLSKDCAYGKAQKAELDSERALVEGKG